MKLRMKTLLIIGTTIVGLIAILYVTSQIVLLNRFVELEEGITRQNVERALNVLFDALSNLDDITFDWAEWDDTYAFIEDGNNDYVKSNLVDGTFINLKLSLMLFINSSDQIVFGKAFDLQNQEEIPIPQSLLELLSANVLLLRHPDTESNINGVVLLPEGPLLVASRPILTSEGEGPIRGALILGRYLGSSEISYLAKIAHLSLTVCRFDDSQMPSDFEEVLPSLSKNEELLIRPLNAELIAGYALLKDIYGQPALVLRVDLPRDVYKQGQASVSFFIMLFIAVSSVFSIVTMLLLEKVVLSRLARLSVDVSRIGTSGLDSSRRISMEGDDELSNLSEAINKMLSALEKSQGEIVRYSEHLEELVEERTRELKKAQEQLLKSERLAAIGELAAMVSHDLRNPLQAITNAVYILKKSAKKMDSKLTSKYINKALNLVPKPARGKFRQGLWKHIEERNKMVHTIDESIHYANNILSDLQDFARTKKPELTEVDLKSLIRETLSHIPIPKNVKVSIRHHALPKLFIDPIQIRRVFTNLITNAIQAMPNGGELTISTSLDNGLVSIRFQDTGIGISKENMDKLFTPLFTTKARGVGLGLVVCKNLVEAHGGSIKVESEKGIGSIFTVKLPINEKMEVKKRNEE